MKVTASLVPWLPGASFSLSLSTNNLWLVAWSNGRTEASLASSLLINPFDCKMAFFCGVICLRIVTQL
jgi:hypothetical protein